MSGGEPAPGDQVAGNAPIVLRTGDGAQVVIHRRGAHVTSWTTPDGREQLYLSPRAVLDGTAAIRGGVPVIFPQFADRGPLPKHGFARTTHWDVAELVTDGATPFARLKLRDTDETRALWPHRFSATLLVAPTAAALEFTLEVRNEGDAPFTFTAALHSYLALDDAWAATVSGLRAVRVTDAITGEPVPGGQTSQVAIRGAVNRVYESVAGPVEVREPGRVVRSTMQGFGDVVLWNPGPEGEAALGDLDPGGSRRMLCVEAAAVASPIALDTGACWSGTQRLEQLAS